MEKLLVVWMEDLLQKKIPIGRNIIKEKALRIYERLQELEPSTSLQTAKKLIFNASEGWLTGFIKRHSFHNVKIKGEVASADENAAKSYPEKLLKIIEDNGYTPDQIFNADETGLFWKKMPTRTYIAKSEKSAGGFKAAKDRVTFLFCSNASGDRILKPLIINRSLKPRALKGKDLKQLPVHWMANKKAWMTADLFKKWFHECFVPEVKKYMEQKGLEFKVLLLIDNAPSHPVLDHPNIQVQFLPPNTTSLIQPLDQGIIATFKMYYIKQAFKYILDSIEERNLTVMDAWKNYTIMHCITHASKAVKQLRTSTLNACWRKIWPECVESGSSVTDSSVVCSEIITLSHAIGGEGFDNMATADIEELMIEKPLDEEDLLEVVPVDDSNENDDDEGEIHQLTSSLIREGLKFSAIMAHHFLTHDPNVERALKFQRNLQLCTAGYQELYKQLEKPKIQPLITDFLIKKKPTSEDVINVRVPSMDSSSLDVLDSSNEDNIAPVANKRARLLPSSDDSTK